MREVIRKEGKEGVMGKEESERDNDSYLQELSHDIDGKTWKVCCLRLLTDNCYS